MKNSSLISKLLMAAVTLGIFSYFGIQVYRYVDDPMQTYYGPGYSARDVLENMADSLETIAQRMT